MKKYQECVKALISMQKRLLGLVLSLQYGIKHNLELFQAVWYPLISKMDLISSQYWDNQSYASSRASSMDVERTISVPL